MDASKLPFRPYASSIKTSFPNAKNRRVGPLISIAMAVSTLALVCLVFGGGRRSSNPRFGIIIDADSSGTRIHVFMVNGKSENLPVIDFTASAAMRVSPGLSAYASEPEKAGDALLELVEFAKGKVGRDEWERTEVRLMATAGLRMLEIEVKERILESCRVVLRSSGFRFEDDWATVILGSDEGIYAWVAANYALGTLGDDPEKTIGIIELGGASAQVTFMSSEPLPAEYSHMLSFGERLYNLYSNSFLHFGQNVAHESLRKLLSSRSSESSSAVEAVDPCSPKGFSPDLQWTSSDRVTDLGHGLSHARGNFSECRSAALMLLKKERNDCSFQQCHLGSTFIPKLQGNFLATENFFYTSKFFGLNPTSSLAELKLAGEQFCGEDLFNIKAKYPNVDESDITRYCFSSAYIVALLHDSLGVSLDDRRIEFANQVGDIQIEWALGAFIVQSMQSISENSDWITTMVHDDLVAPLLFVASCLVVLAAWLVSKLKKPQLKTIYDLEKGRYLITRIS